MPEVGTEFSAGIDLKSAVTCVVAFGDTVTIGTGVKMEIPKFVFGLVAPRSGLNKHKDVHVVLKNTVGIIDSDYRGEILVKLTNLGKEPLPIYRGDRLCQIILVPHLKPAFSVVPESELTLTTRGTGGFGHTGK